MKISIKKTEIFFIAFLYLFAVYFWTIPIHNNKMPFGDVDASSHFVIGDYMSSHDTSTYKIPYSVKFRYGSQNDAYPGYLWYPPQYWTIAAMTQVLGGERIVPFFILVAVLSSIVVLSLYFLIRHLYGFWVAFLSSFLLIFSVRDFMVYLWGQWPQSLSFAFTPLILYCVFRYFSSENSKTVYIYMIAIFLSAQFFFHPQGMIAAIGASAIFLILLFAKTKKFPVNKSQFKHILFSIVIFTIIVSIFAPFNVGEFVSEILPKSEGSGTSSGGHLDVLFKWYQGIKGDGGLPDFYFTYNLTHGSLDGGIFSWWTLPFLLFGIFILITRRKEEDLLMLSWFVSFYFLTRLVIIGAGSRDIRMFAYEAHVFYPIVALGFISLSSLAPNPTLKTYSKIGLVCLFVILSISINARSAFKVLDSQQYSIGRINPYQYEAAQWLMGHTEEMSDIYDIGTLGYQNYAAKTKWMGVLSQRHFIQDDPELNMTDYVLIDYTDAILLRNQDYENSLKSIETRFSNLTPIYNKNEIRVYKVAGISI